MSNVGFATLQIIPSAQGFGSALSKGVDPHFSAAGKSGGVTMGNTAKSSFLPAFRGIIAPMAGIFAASGVVDFFRGAVAEASDLGESLNAVNVVFGKSAKGIIDLGNNAATAVGLSRVEFNGLAVQFSNFAQAVAGPGGDVVKTMRDLTGRAADFASVMNIDVAEAASLFQSGLAGETEPLRRYGIDLSAAAVGNYAVANGIATSANKMTEAQKVQARYGLLMASTAKTQGDFANTSDSLANRQRILSAEWANTKASLGGIFIPLAASALGVVTQLMAGATTLGRGFAAIWASFRTGEVSTGGFIGVMQSIGSLLGVVVLPAIRNFIAELRDRLAPVVTAMQPALDTLRGAFDTVVSYIRDNAHPILVALGAAAGVLVAGGINTLVGIVGGALLGVLGALVSVLASPIALFAALAAGIVYAYQKSETFRDIVARAMEISRSAFETVVSFVRANFQPTVERLSSFVSGTLLPAFRYVADFLTSTFRPTFSALVNLVLNQVWPALVGLVSRVRENLDEFSGFAKMIGTVIAIVAALVAKVAGFLLPILVSLAGFLIGTVFDAIGLVIGILGSLAQAVTTIVTTFGRMLSAVGTVLNGLVSVVKGVVNIVIGIFTGDLGRIKDGAKQAADGVLDIIRGLGKLILAALSGFGTLLVGVGGDLLRGLANGIKGAVKGVVDAAVGAAKAVINGVKGALGINSPSKVFAELGGYVGEGFAQGIESLVPRSQDAMAAMVAPPSVADINAGLRGGASLSVVAGQADVAAAVVSLADGLEDLRREIRRQTDRGVLLTQKGVQR